MSEPTSVETEKSTGATTPLDKAVKTAQNGLGPNTNASPTEAQNAAARIVVDKAAQLIGNHPATHLAKQISTEKPNE